MKKIFAMLITAGCFAGFQTNAQVNDMSSDTASVSTPSGDQNRDNYKQNRDGYDQNQNPSGYHNATQVDKNDMIKIRSSELPSMVTQTLNNSDYAGWTIMNAYRTKGNDQYLVEVKKGSQTKSYWFDKNGNRLENKTGTHKSGNGAGASSGSGSGSSSGTLNDGTGSSSGSSGSSSGTTTPDR